MKTYNIYYNDGVFAEQVSFPEEATNEEIMAYFDGIIENYNTCQNPDYHITSENIRRCV